MLIEDGDVSALRGIIKRVIESDNDCDDKKDFLNNLLNGIQRFLITYDNRLEDQEKYLSGLEKDLSQAQDDLAWLLKERKITGIGLSKLKEELNGVLAKIAWHEKRIKENKEEINDFKGEIELRKKSIWNLKDVLIPKVKSKIKYIES